MKLPSPVERVSPVGKSAAGPGPALAGSCAAYFLVECMVYIGVLVVVMAVAFSAFYRCLDHSRSLARNADDILGALHAGERWRADIRQAIAPPRVLSEGDAVACEIARTNGSVTYLFADGAVWRKESDATPIELLPRVSASTMIQDRREKVTSWRWELHLTPKKKNARLQPLFTFQAVPLLQNP